MLKLAAQKLAAQGWTSTAPRPRSYTPLRVFFNARACVSGRRAGSARAAPDGAHVERDARPRQQLGVYPDATLRVVPAREPPGVPVLQAAPRYHPRAREHALRPARLHLLPLPLRRRRGRRHT
eukprot:6187364-Pleurochrysis_carterae.AAC.2